MTALHPALVFLGGLAVVVLGAELLLKSATRIAHMLRISPIVIGLTVVAIGTSLPELAVGITAAAEGKGALAVGNVAGANILVLLLVLGLSAAIRPLPIQPHSLRLEVPAMIGAALALIIMSIDGVLTRTEGALLVLAAVFYTALIVQSSRRDRRLVADEFLEEYAEPLPPLAERRQQFIRQGLLLAVSITLTIYGAELLVDGASALAARFGVSDAVIGLTIVALGTSSPELVTTVVATLRGERDVAIGNLLGSAVYNILAILGTVMLVSPRAIDVSRELLFIDLPVAAAVAMVCLPVFRSGHMITRTEGLGFVAAYFSYMALLLLTRV